MTTKSRIAKLEGVRRGAFVVAAKVLIVRVKHDGTILELDGVQYGADAESQARAKKIIDNHPRNGNGTPGVIEIVMPEGYDEDEVKADA